jgi:hypothetical protein
MLILHDIIGLKRNAVDHDRGNNTNKSLCKGLVAVDVQQRKSKHYHAHGRSALTIDGQESEVSGCCKWTRK